MSISYICVLVIHHHMHICPAPLRVFAVFLMVCPPPSRSSRRACRMSGRGRVPPGRRWRLSYSASDRWRGRSALTLCSLPRLLYPPNLYWASAIFLQRASVLLSDFSNVLIGWFILKVFIWVNVIYFVFGNWKETYDGTEKIFPAQWLIKMFTMKISFSHFA